MTWSTITAALLERRMPTDYKTLQKAAVAAKMDWDTTVSEVIENVVNMVRGYVSGPDKKPLGAAGSVPPECVAVTITLLRLELIAIIPGGVNLADDLRRSMEKRAHEYLALVAKGTIGTTPPDTSPASQPVSVDPLVGGDLANPWPDTPYSGNSATDDQNSGWVN